MVKLLISWKHQFSKLLKLKNEQHRCKELEPPVQKMVWYAMFRWKLFEIWGTKIWKNANKMLINCWISSFFRLSILHISKSFHRNIAYHTIFWTNFSRSFQWCYSFFDLSNFKNWYFYHIKGLTITTKKAPGDEDANAQTFRLLIDLGLEYHYALFGKIQNRHINRL